ncbi:MAG TPA: FAD/NAD(P)-binding protein [Candidatus Sulfotelmatobacter sp.]|nr:FAD/NAD(P)-binding protein [Candidatus Sulfotelmatobacter sp.]
MPDRSVVIAGGGASGALLAAALIRGGLRAPITIVEPGERLGAGMAYATDCPLHLLNAPARAMSAFADDPDHFVRWLATHAPEHAGPQSFAPRGVYGAYLHAIATRARAVAGARLQHRRALVVDAEIDDQGVRAVCSDGATLRADALVVATGNAEPAAWPRLGSGAELSPRFFRSAWAPGALDAESDETVVLLGTGLTAVDAVLGLRHRGHRGTIVMVSRRGLLPHEHRLFDAPPAAAPEAETARDLLDAMRTLADDARGVRADWRVAVDRVRPRANVLWQALSLAEQRRFVRHVMPYWNVHRHRVAPEAAKLLAELFAADTLRTLAGRTGEIAATPAGLRVPIRLRGSDEQIVLEAARVVNCSGPEHDFRHLANPLIAQLLARGTMTPYPLHIGVQVAQNGTLIGRDGAAQARVYALGPVRFGTLIETTAIPEIALQARELAARLMGEEPVALAG